MHLSKININTRFQIGSDIKGARVSVVAGSQEERYAFSAGAIPKSFDSLSDVLDNLEAGGSEFALVDPFYALYFSDLLQSRNINPQDILPHTGVHGILAMNMTAAANQCFAKFVAQKHHEAFGFLMHSLGSLKGMHGKTAHHTTHKLLGSNMIVIYVCCALFLAMLTSCCIWEIVWYRPKLRRIKAKLRSRNMNGNSKESLLADKEDVHSL